MGSQVLSRSPFSDVDQVRRMLESQVGVGDIVYVSSTAAGASDSNDGYDPNYPLATLDGAFNLSTAPNVVIVLPSHAETYSTTGTKVTGDKANVRVIGVGEGSARPTFTFGHTGATMVFSSNGISLENLLFVTSVDSVTTYATISGDDCKLINCEGRDTTDIEVITDFTVTGDRFIADRYTKHGYTGGNANVRVFGLNASINSVIQNCKFITKVTTAVVNFITTLSTGVRVKDCMFYVNSTSDLSKNVVDTIGSSTWTAENCFDLTAGTKFSGSSSVAVAGDDVSAVATNASKIDSLTLATAPTANSLAAFIASGGTALGTELGDSASLIDAIGFDGVASVASTAGMLRTAAGTTFLVSKSLTQSAVVSGGVALTAASAGGDLLIEDIVIQNGSTQMDSAGDGAVLEIYSNNTLGSGSFITTAEAKLLANVVVSGATHTTFNKFVLESGKVISVKATTEDFTSAGTVEFNIICRRLADGASVAAA